MNSQDASSSSPTPEARAPAPRPRSRREQFAAEPKLNPWQRLPRYRRFLLVFLAIGILVASFHERLLELYEWLLPATAAVQLLGPDGAPIALEGHADVFPIDRTVFMPSPGPHLGKIELEGGAERLTLDSGRYPASIQLRFHVPGYGVDYVSVDFGKRRTAKLKLGPPVAVEGIVLDVSGARVAGAEVSALGGDSRGVLLATATTNTEGKYTLTGISSRVDFLTLRVLKNGYAMEEREHWLDASPGELASKTDFKLVPVPPVRGSVRFPVGCAASPVTVSVLQLAGVSAAVDSDGSFVLHHLATERSYRILLQGLPPGFTHRVTYVRPGETTVVEVVPAVTLRGQVRSQRFGRPVPNVELWHSHTTRGNERCLTDANGNFALENVPTGAVSLNVVAPTSYFGGLVVQELVEVKPEHGHEPIAIRIR